MPARVRPGQRVRVQGDCRRERAPPCGARQRRRHKALERESPQGAQPTGIPAGVETRFILARNGRSRCGERPQARNGRSRATRRAAAGRAVTKNLFNRARRSVTQPISWWAQKGRGRLGRPPTPQAPQARGAQCGSRDAERPRAIYSFSATACRLDGSIILHRHERYSMHHTPPVQQVNVRTMSACSVLS